MTKVRETWAFQELMTSTKLNEANTDYITRGQLILSTTGSADLTTYAVGGPGKVVADPIIFPAFPYNPAKQLFDRMRVWAIVAWDESVCGNPWLIDYTLDSGASWVNAPLPDAILPVTIRPVTPYGAVTNPGTEDFIRNQETIDISGIAAFQWLGWRIRNGIAVDDWVAWAINVWLYSSTDTPE